MNLQDLLAQGRLRRRSTRREEIRGLLQVADRDLGDAAVPGLSSDRLLLIAYEAALALATIPLRGAGYETYGLGHHWTTFQALPLIIGNDFADLSDYFESCRNKRNVGPYDRSGVISRSEASEVVEEAKAFNERLRQWLGDRYPELAD